MTDLRNADKEKNQTIAMQEEQINLMLPKMETLLQQNTLFKKIMTQYVTPKDDALPSFAV